MPLVPVGLYGRRAVRRISPWAGYSSALATLLSEAQSSGLVLDFTQNLAFRAGTSSTIAGVSGWTYTRSGTAYDLAGTTSFGANVPRRTSAGLLVEAGATNLLTNSDCFTLWAADAGGSGIAPTATNAFAAGPDGTTTAVRLQLNRVGAGSFSRWQRSVVTPSQQSVGSVWMRTTSGSGTANVGLRVGTGTGVNCVVTGAWQRFGVVGPAAVTDGALQVMLWDTIAGNDVSADILVCGGQVEAGASATAFTSLIPTSGTSASRGADAASVTGLTFSGAHSVIALTGVKGNGSSESIYQLSDGTTANRSLIYRNSANAMAFVDSGSVNQANQSSGTWTAAAQRLAMRVQTNDVRLAVDGTLGPADTTATLPVGTLSTLSVGTTSSTIPLGGLIQLLAILPRALSDGELTGATA